MVCFINHGYTQLVPVYSQYLVNQSIINPAYAGANNCLNINALYRQQWQNFEGAPSTRTLSAHSPLVNRSLAVGLNLVNDVIGVTSNTLIEGLFAYRTRVGETSKLAFGLSAGFLNNKNGFASLNVNDADDAVFTSNNATTLPVFSFGSYFENKRWFAGFSMLNLTRRLPERKTFLYQQPIYLLGGYRYVLSENVILSPSLLLKHVSSNPLQLDANLMLDYRGFFTFGLSYRSSEALYGIILIKLNEQLQLGYSYDHSFSVLRKYQHGSHELTVRYIFQYKTNTVDVKSFE